VPAPTLAPAPAPAQSQRAKVAAEAEGALPTRKAALAVGKEAQHAATELDEQHSMSAAATRESERKGEWAVRPSSSVVGDRSVRKSASAVASELVVRPDKRPAVPSTTKPAENEVEADVRAGAKALGRAAKRVAAKPPSPRGSDRDVGGGDLDDDRSAANSSGDDYLPSSKRRKGGDVSASSSSSSSDSDSESDEDKPRKSKGKRRGKDKNKRAPRMCGPNALEVVRNQVSDEQVAEIRALLNARNEELRAAKAAVRATAQATGTGRKRFRKNRVAIKTAAQRAPVTLAAYEFDEEMLREVKQELAKELAAETKYRVDMSQLDVEAAPKSKSRAKKGK
jgi:hypothetical protein